MAFDFPNSPSDGAEFTPPGGQTYVYNLASAAWNIKADAGGGTPVDAYTKAESDALFQEDIAPGTINDYWRGDKTWQPNNHINNVTVNKRAHFESNSFKINNQADGLGHDFIDMQDQGATGTARLTLSPLTSHASLVMNKPASGTINQIIGQMGGKYRWFIQMGDQAPESGANTGSDFNINSYQDDGTTSNGTVFGINRKTHDVFMKATKITFDGSTIQGGTTSLSLAVGQQGYIYWKASGDNTTRNAYYRGDAGHFTIAGQGYKATAGDWAAASDARIKNVTGDYTTGLEAIKALTIRKFTFKGNETILAEPGVDASQPNKEKDVSVEAQTVPYPDSPRQHLALAGTEFVGLIAQEAELVMPDLVEQVPAWIDGAPVPDLRQLDTTNLTYALINAVKELAARVEALEGA